MSFFSKLLTAQPYRVGEKNFDRARRAEMRRDFDKAKEYFEEAATAFDQHLAQWEEAGKEVKPSHLIMAGMSFVRLGRDADGLKVLEQALREREIPDGYLHAGYAAAKLGDAGKTEKYWSAYPKWAAQPHVAKGLKQAVATLRETAEPDLDALCADVAKAAHEQDWENKSFMSVKSRWEEYLRNRQY